MVVQDKRTTSEKRAGIVQASKRLGYLADKAMPLVLFFCFFGLYLGSIDIHAKKYTWNFLFDADPDRVIRVFTHRDWPSGDVSKHPLYVILYKPITRLLNTHFHDPATSTLIVTSFIGSLSVLFAYLIFLKFLRHKFEAILFTVIFGCSSSVWFLCSITETFSLNLAMIVFAFYAQTLSIPIKDSMRIARFNIAYVLYSLASVGTTLTNIVYSFLGYANFLRKRKKPFVPLSAHLLIYLFIVVILLMASSLLQHRIYPGAFVFTSPKSFVRAVTIQKEAGWVRTSPDFLFNASRLYKIGRTYLFDNMVAPKVIVNRLSPPFIDSYRGRMLDLSPKGNLLYAISALFYLSALIASLTIFVRRALRGKDDKDAQLAILFMIFNLAFQFTFYHRTAPLIYSVHLAFSLVFLMIFGYRHINWPLKKFALLALTLLVIANNYFFIEAINTYLKNPSR